MRQIPLTQGHVALVDDADYDAMVAVGRWQVGNCDGRLYAQHAANRRVIRMHSLLTGWPMTDHINGDGLDNRRSNLRAATPTQNAGNTAAPRNNTSGYKGVSLYRRTGKWRASITIAGRAQHLGYFGTAPEAAVAYDAAAIAHFGDFARPNFPTLEESA